VSFHVKDESPPWAHIVYSTILQIKRASHIPMMRAVMPYCLHPMDDPEGPRCMVNRSYSVVGTTAVWSDYEEAKGWHVLHERFEELRKLGVVNEDGYFYNDATSPRHRRADFVRYREKVLELLSPWVK
jgi:hypothetical protein